MNEPLKYYFSSLFLFIEKDAIKQSIQTASIHENHLFVVFNINNELHSIDIKKDARHPDSYDYKLLKKSLKTEESTLSSCSFQELESLFKKFLQL